MSDRAEAAPPSPSTGGLVRGLGLLDATMLVVGSMIGSGIFITSAESSRLVAAPGWLLVAWALAGLLTITGALCCAELAGMMPHAGGQYVFLREAYGRPVGFLFGWSLYVVIQTGTIAAVAIAFANFTGVFFPAISPDNYLIEPNRFGRFALSLSTQQLAAIASILLLTYTNQQGLKAGKWVQNTLTGTKTIALIGLIVLGLSLGFKKESAAFTSSWWSPSANGWTELQKRQAELPADETLALAMLLGLAMVGPLFSQTAWNNVTYTAGEIREPGRNLPRALVLGCGSVILLYLLANVAYVVTLPLAGIQDAPKDRVGTATMLAILGEPGVYLMAGAIMISTFGCNNGLILAGARVFYAMARDGLFFPAIRRLNSHHVPAVALWAQGLWASLLTLPRIVRVDAAGATTYGNVYSQLLEYIVSVELSFYMLMVLSVILFRRWSPTHHRPYRTFAYPLTPILYLTLAALLIIDQVYLAPLTAGVGFLIVLSGLPIYAVMQAMPKSPAVSHAAEEVAVSSD